MRLITGIGAEPGQNEQRNPSTKLPTDASGCRSIVRISIARLVRRPGNRRSSHMACRPLSFLPASVILTRVTSIFWLPTRIVFLVSLGEAVADRAGQHVFFFWWDNSRAARAPLPPNPSEPRLLAVVAAP